MAKKSIPQLVSLAPATRPLNGTEAVHCSQGGVSKGLSLNMGVVTVTGNYTVAAGISTVLVNAATATITLPTISTTYISRYIRIIKISSGAGTITILRGSTNTIEGSEIKTLNGQYAYIDLIIVSASTWGVLALCDECTYVPVLAFGAASVGITYTNQVGWYQRIKQWVKFTAFINLSSKGSSVGDATITVPFTSKNITGNYPQMSVVYINVTQVNAFAYINVNTNLALLKETDGAGASSAITNSDFTDTSQIIMSGEYYI